MTHGRFRNLWRASSETVIRDRVTAMTVFSGCEGQKGSDEEPSTIPGSGIKLPCKKILRVRNRRNKWLNNGSGASEAREGQLLK